MTVFVREPRFALRCYSVHRKWFVLRANQSRVFPFCVRSFGSSHSKRISTRCGSDESQSWDIAIAVGPSQHNGTWNGRCQGWTTIWMRHQSKSASSSSHFASPSSNLHGKACLYGHGNSQSGMCVRTRRDSMMEHMQKPHWESNLP